MLDSTLPFLVVVFFMLFGIFIFVVINTLIFLTLLITDTWNDFVEEIYEVEIAQYKMKERDSLPSTVRAMLKLFDIIESICQVLSVISPIIAGVLSAILLSCLL